MIYLLPLLALALISMPLIPVYRGLVTGQKAKKRLLFNLASFLGLAILAIVFPIGGSVFAAEAANAASSASSGLKFIGAAIATGMSSLGAGIAVASAAPAAIGAVSEDPKIFGKSMIFIVLGEGVALYGMIISILIIFSK